MGTHVIAIGHMDEKDPLHVKNMAHILILLENQEIEAICPRHDSVMTLGTILLVTQDQGNIRVLEITRLEPAEIIMILETALLVNTRKDAPPVTVQVGTGVDQCSDLRVLHRRCANVIALHYLKRGVLRIL